MRDRLPSPCTLEQIFSSPYKVILADSSFFHSNHPALEKIHHGEGDVCSYDELEKRIKYLYEDKRVRTTSQVIFELEGSRDYLVRSMELLGMKKNKNAKYRKEHINKSKEIIKKAIHCLNYRVLEPDKETIKIIDELYKLRSFEICSHDKIKNFKEQHKNTNTRKTDESIVAHAWRLAHSMNYDVAILSKDKDICNMIKKISFLTKQDPELRKMHLGFIMGIDNFKTVDKDYVIGSKRLYSDCNPQNFSSYVDLMKSIKIYLESKNSSIASK